MTTKTTWRNENTSELLQAGIAFEDVLKLQRIARALHRIDEDSCSIAYTDEQQARIDKREARLKKRAEVIAADYGKQIYRQGDPRGWPLYLVLDSMTDQEAKQNYNRELAVCPY